MGSALALKVQENTAGRFAKTRSTSVKKHKLKTKVVPIALKKKSDSCLSLEEREALVIEFRLKARKLARSILRRWHSRLDLQEVDSVVDLSLCEAVKRYNPKKGASFMTFLFYHLRGNLIRAVTEAASSNLVPLQDYDVEGSSEQNGESSNSASKGAPNAIEIAEALCKHDYPLPDEELFRKELSKIQREACSELDPLAREVIERIYLDEEHLMDIARSLGYSRCHISRVKRRALENLEEKLSSLLHTEQNDGNTVRNRDSDGHAESDIRRKVRRLTRLTTKRKGPRRVNLTMVG